MSRDPSLARRLAELTSWGELSAEDEAAISAQLESAWQRGQATWPALSVPLDGWLRSLGRDLDGPGAVLEFLGTFHAEDFYLAQACATGDGAALREFESHCHRVLEAAVTAMRLPSDVAGDVAQEVRQRLFVKQGDEAPKIASYSGRAALRGWTRTVMVRAAVSRLRQRADLPVDDDMLAEIPEAAAGADVQHFRNTYGAEFKAAFTEAMASLKPRQRTVLRLHLIDGLSIDEIGTIYQVHKTTAFRWIEEAKALLSKRTINGFHKRIPVSPSEMQSIARLLQSQIDLSLSRILGEAEDE